MTNGEQRPPGVMDSFRRLGDAALGTIQTRVELLAIELAEEKRRLVATLLWSGAAVFFTGVALLTITATIVVLSPPKARPIILIGFSVVYAIAAVVAISKAREQTKNGGIPLSSTIAELKKDLAALRSRE